MYIQGSRTSLESLKLPLILNTQKVVEFFLKMRRRPWKVWN